MKDIDVQIRDLFIISTVAFLFSVIFGCFLAYNRLMKLRLTAKIVRSLDKFPSPDKVKQKERMKWREVTKTLGKFTWFLLPLQLITFLFGLIFTILVVICRLS